MAYIHFTTLGASHAPSFAKDGFVKYNKRDAEAVKAAVLAKRALPPCSEGSEWVGRHLARLEQWRDNHYSSLD